MDLNKLFKDLIEIPSSTKGFWIAILFSIVCLCVYEWGLSRKDTLYRYLESKMVALTEEREREKAVRHGLREEIEAHHDPEWIGLALKKNLGAVKAGEAKIIFKVPN